MDETKEVKVKKKKKLSKSGLIVVIGIIIIVIPCLVFAAILGISALQTGSPRDGSRFKDDLVTEISKDDCSSIQADLASISGVENVEVKVSEGQLKVFIDTNDSLTEAQVDTIVSDAYAKVTSKLPVTTYFTRTADAKMYDLQINVYTTAEASANRQYKLLHKNSSEESFQIDDLAHPKDAELVKELEGKAIADAATDASEDTEEKPTE